jgi:hypothetical protein
MCFFLTCIGYYWYSEIDQNFLTFIGYYWYSEIDQNFLTFIGYYCWHIFRNWLENKMEPENNMEHFIRRQLSFGSWKSIGYQYHYCRGRQFVAIFLSTVLSVIWCLMLVYRSNVAKFFCANYFFNWSVWVYILKILVVTSLNYV